MTTAMHEPTVQVPMVTVNGNALGAQSQPDVVRERIGGLRLRRVPSGSLLAQLVGALLFLAGLFYFCTIVWGPGIGGAVTMLTTGAATLVLGTLREAKII